MKTCGLRINAWNKDGANTVQYQKYPTGPVSGWNTSLLLQKTSGNNATLIARENYNIMYYRIHIARFVPVRLKLRHEALVILETFFHL